MSLVSLFETDSTGFMEIAVQVIDRPMNFISTMTQNNCVWYLEFSGRWLESRPSGSRCIQNSGAGWQIPLSVSINKIVNWVIGVYRGFDSSINESPNPVIDPGELMQQRRSSIYAARTIFLSTLMKSVIKAMLVRCGGMLERRLFVCWFFVRCLFLIEVLIPPLSLFHYNKPVFAYWFFARYLSGIY